MDIPHREPEHPVEDLLVEPEEYLDEPPENQNSPQEDYADLLESDGISEEDLEKIDEEDETDA